MRWLHSVLIAPIARYLTPLLKDAVYRFRHRYHDQIEYAKSLAIIRWLWFFFSYLRKLDRKPIILGIQVIFSVVLVILLSLAWPYIHRMSLYVDRHDAYMSRINDHVHQHIEDLMMTENSPRLCYHPSKWIYVIHATKNGWNQVRAVVRELEALEYPAELENAVEIQIWMDERLFREQQNEYRKQILRSFQPVSISSEDQQGVNETGNDAGPTADISEYFLIDTLPWSHGHKMIRPLRSWSRGRPFASSLTSAWIEHYLPSSVLSQARREYCQFVRNSTKVYPERSIEKLSASAASSWSSSVNWIFLENRVKIGASFVPWVHQSTKAVPEIQRMYGKRVGAVSADSVDTSMYVYHKQCALELFRGSSLLTNPQFFEEQQQGHSKQFSVLNCDDGHGDSAPPLFSFVFRPFSLSKGLYNELLGFSVPASRAFFSARYPLVKSMVVSADVWDGFHKFFHMLRTSDAWWDTRAAYLRSVATYSSWPPFMEPHPWISDWFAFLKTTNMYMMHPSCPCGSHIIALRNHLISGTLDQTKDLVKAGNRMRQALRPEKVHFLKTDLHGMDPNTKTCVDVKTKSMVNLKSLVDGHAVPLSNDEMPAKIQQDVAKQDLLDYSWIFQIQSHMRRNNQSILPFTVAYEGLYESVMNWQCSLSEGSGVKNAPVVFTFQSNYARKLERANTSMLVIDLSSYINEWECPVEHDGQTSRCSASSVRLFTNEDPIKRGSQLYWHSRLIRWWIVSKLLDFSFDVMLFDAETTSSGIRPQEFLETVQAHPSACDLSGVDDKNHFGESGTLYFRSSLQSRWLISIVLQSFASHVRSRYRYVSNPSNLLDDYASDHEIFDILSSKPGVDSTPRDSSDYLSFETDMTILNRAIENYSPKGSMDSWKPLILGLQHTPQEWMLSVNSCRHRLRDGKLTHQGHPWHWNETTQQCGR